MSSRPLTAAVAACAVLLAGVTGLASQPKPALDFDFFARRVQPIFLQKRAGHTRCYVCHADGNNALRLEKLTPGSPTWSEEQSRKNFAAVSLLVNPGDPGASRLLLHPLAPEGGGDIYHSGGRQFASRSDPAFKTLARWINGATLGGH